MWFDIDAIADTASALPHMAPTPARFEQLLAELGVANADRVVFYDQKGIFSAPRGWWLLRLFGHERTAVLDGGLVKWRREGRALESGEPPRRAPVTYQARFNARYLRGLGDMLDNLASRRELVLDARSAERFHARVSEPRPGLRGGHIPAQPQSALRGVAERRADATRARGAARALCGPWGRRAQRGSDQLRLGADRRGIEPRSGGCRTASRGAV